MRMTKNLIRIPNKYTNITKQLLITLFKTKIKLSKSFTRSSSSQSSINKIMFILIIEIEIKKT